MERGLHRRKEMREMSRSQIETAVESGEQFPQYAVARVPGAVKTITSKRGPVRRASTAIAPLVSGREAAAAAAAAAPATAAAAAPGPHPVPAAAAATASLRRPWTALTQLLDSTAVIRVNECVSYREGRKD
ncbi:STE20/SPS1-related proline-alanine-rich protein kinase-like [Schistocerca nitens]|uniref:STE20/SPS1-related proline-alanine-rich protein kinase-like n=1 Tax=Schistocerca nitens TaxID=7011 RepID=UPI0021189F4A|nr:STE20/SPS1-related proline-alanine-rich protein kinase-like [Schistocerca nitens]